MPKLLGCVSAAALANLIVAVTSYESNADCQQSLNNVNDFAEKLSLQINVPSELRAGQPVKISWQNPRKLQVEFSVYLVVSTSTASRFSGTGFMGLNAGATGPSDIKYVLNSARAFVPLHRSFDSTSGEFSIIPYRRGEQPLNWAMVTGGPCGEHVFLRLTGLMIYT
jgi:hypothetical protein